MAPHYFTSTLFFGKSFVEGIPFDGSSIRGWQGIYESDMLLIPEVETAFIDPFFSEPTLSISCYVVDPITKEPYNKDPRSIAKKAIAYLNQTGIGDAAFFGPEAEFFILIMYALAAATTIVSTK